MPALLAYFTQDAARRLRHPVSLSPEVLGVLLTYEWPGNVRELETGVNHAASIAGSRRVELRDFPHTHFAATSASLIAPAGLLLKPGIDAAERLALEEALAAAGGDAGPPRSSSASVSAHCSTSFGVTAWSKGARIRCA